MEIEKKIVFHDNTKDARYEILKVMPKIEELCSALRNYAVTDEYFNGKHFAYLAALLGSYAEVIRNLAKCESLNYSLRGKDK